MAPGSLQNVLCVVFIEKFIMKKVCETCVK